MATGHGEATLAHADGLGFRQEAVVGQVEAQGMQPCPEQPRAVEAPGEMETSLEMDALSPEAPEQGREAWMLLDQGHVHARPGEQQGGGHTRDAAADDEGAPPRRIRHTARRSRR